APPAHLAKAARHALLHRALPRDLRNLPHRGTHGVDAVLCQVHAAEGRLGWRLHHCHRLRRGGGGPRLVRAAQDEAALAAAAAELRCASEGGRRGDRGSLTEFWNPCDNAMSEELIADLRGIGRA